MGSPTTSCAPQVAVPEGRKPLPLTHATVARNFAPIGPSMRVVESAAIYEPTGLIQLSQV